MSQQNNAAQAVNEWKMVPTAADLRMAVAGGVALTEASERDLEATVSELQACYAAMVAASPGASEPPQWLRDVCRYISETLADATLSTGERKVARTIMHMLPLDAAAPPSPAPQPAQDGALLSQVRALLWDEHPECCGQPVVGAEYMGDREMVCCGCPEPAMLNDAQIVASLRSLLPAAAQEGATK